MAMVEGDASMNPFLKSNPKNQIAEQQKRIETISITELHQLDGSKCHR